MCLLDILRRIREEKILDIEIYVAHINHMIRENAKLDEEYVKEYCKKYNIELFIKHAEIKKIANINKKGIEETGRKVRYDFFEDVMKNTNSNKIAIAHNSNDNAETMIMNLLRGSGVSGLKGIEPKRDNKYIRPLIKCSREEIEEYCKLNNIEPRIDETNFENEYTRNKIRNICIPYIKKEFNPNIINTLNRLSDTIREEDEYVSLKVEETFKNILEEELEGQIVLNLKKYLELEKVIKKRIIIYAINRILGNSKDLQKINIEDIVEMCEKNIGNKFIMPNKNVKVMLKNKKIYFIKNNLEI
ncbi:MAG: tRNA lysidine(34) synthetase TilS [Clostridia bacterium]|nr:tRNA lysidine(34) synthetase TilS [Clostridia bacterium]